MLSSLFLTFSLAVAAGDACESPRDYKTFYACSLKRHPLSEAANLKAQEGEAYLDQAAQWENPSLDMKTVTGTNGGENVGSTEITVAIPLTQLWTRAAKNSLAMADKKKTEIEAMDTLLGVKKDLIRDVYRLRQIEHEAGLIKETLDTFATIQRQFKSRRARGPEQEVTLNLVELATSDYQLKENRLMTERLEIISRMKGIWGADFEIKPEFLPPPHVNWPAIDDKKASSPSLEVQRVLAEAERTIAEKKVVDRQSWPELKIGPAIERTSEGPSQFYQYGVTMSVTLPLLTWNQGSRKLAETRATQARFIADYTKNKSQLESEIHLKKYLAAVSSLKLAFKDTEMTKKHARVESLYKQGLLTGSLVIEAHRQQYEYTVSQHEHENAAIEAFLELKTLRGEDIEEILQ